jgi:hypothetical protein
MTDAPSPRKPPSAAELEASSSDRGVVERGGLERVMSEAGAREGDGVESPSAADARVRDAWCAWLDALATDAEAALAAAMAYKELDARARETWLKALEQDADRVGVPRVAMYAPLLAVESDPERRRKITHAMGPFDVRATPRSAILGMRGRAPSGTLVAAVVSPLYLDFVQVLACGYRPEQGFLWVRHDPIVDRSRSPRPGFELEGAKLEMMPMKALVDELAVTVLAHQRSGRPLPEALRVFADLFGPFAGSSHEP